MNDEMTFEKFHINEDGECVTVTHYYGGFLNPEIYFCTVDSNPQETFVISQAFINNNYDYCAAIYYHEDRVSYARFGNGNYFTSFMHPYDIFWIEFADKYLGIRIPYNEATSPTNESEEE